MCFDPVSLPQKRPCFVRARWLKLGSQKFSEPQVELQEEFQAIPVFFFLFAGDPENGSVVRSHCSSREMGCEVAFLTMNLAPEESQK